MSRWIIFLSVVVLVVQCDWNVQEHLGTKTPYWSENSTTPTPVPAGCNIVHLDLLCRHGARYPSSGDIKSLNTLTSLIKQYNAQISDNYPYIKAWTNPYDQAGILDLAGQQELYQMGMRFNATYYPLLSQEYYPDVYVMQSTQVSRAGVSASAFAQGYLQGQGNLGPNHFEPTFIYSDTDTLDILRFFDNCPLYTQLLDNGTLDAIEAEKYTNQQYPAIAQRVATALGVSGVWNITIDQLDSMLTACAFEVSAFNKLDGWCPLFSPDDINAFEYVDDLENYQQVAYGSGIGYKISAVLLQSIVETMDGVISGDLDLQLAYLRFAHAEDIMPFTALLGLFKDSYPLTADLTPEQIENRKWRDSIISPFAANYAFALYECTGNQYKVKLVHNEVEYNIPGCSSLYCPYTEFKALYAEALAFNFSEACALDTPTPPSKETVPFLLFAVAVVGAFLGGAVVVFFFAAIYMRKRPGVKYSALNH